MTGALIATGLAFILFLFHEHIIEFVLRVIAVVICMLIAVFVIACIWLIIYFAWAM